MSDNEGTETEQAGQLAAFVNDAVRVSLDFYTDGKLARVELAWNYPDFDETAMRSMLTAARFTPVPQWITTTGGGSYGGSMYSRVGP